MPFKPDPLRDEHYAIIIGECPQYKAPKGFVRYTAASIRGTFTLAEASAFMVDFLGEEEVPRYEDFFLTEPIRVHPVGISLVKPVTKTTYPKLRYYVDHYSPVAYISEYEWNVARHDIHTFLDPERKSRSVFGDLL